MIVQGFSSSTFLVATGALATGVSCLFGLSIFPGDQVSEEEMLSVGGSKVFEGCC